MYLIIEEGKPTGFSNIRQTDADIEVANDKLQLEAYSFVNNELVYDDSFVLAKAVRLQRDSLLAKTDWTRLDDVSPTVKAQYETYRQALRDITLQEGFPQTVIWPDLP